VNSGTNTLTVVRGVGGGAAAINDNDELLLIGSAQPEGDTSKPARSGNPTKVTNYTQIHRTPYESTETLIHSDTFTPRRTGTAGEPRVDRAREGLGVHLCSAGRRRT
jgi:hypothetical protein